MKLEELNALLDDGQRICEGSEGFALNSAISFSTRDALRAINDSSLSDEEASAAFLRLIGEKAEGFRFFRPVYLDYGRNLHLGNNVFINALTTIQDQGGVYIGNRVYIGHRVSIATLNHGFEPCHRGDLLPRSVHIGDDVWIGDGAIILPGVRIGHGSIVGAGAVVSRDIPPESIAVGVPAKVVGPIGDRQ